MIKSRSRHGLEKSSSANKRLSGSPPSSPSKNKDPSAEHNNGTSTRLLVLTGLCLQSSLFTVLRRYSLDIRKETYSEFELLLVGELVKLVFSCLLIQRSRDDSSSSSSSRTTLLYLIKTSRKMMFLATVYGVMNMLSLVAWRHMGAGLLLTVSAPLKILSTAALSAALLRRHCSPTQWRALLALCSGVLLLAHHSIVWGNNSNENDEQQEQQAHTTTTTTQHDGNNNNSNVVLGTAAVLLEATLSGFGSVYFEKVIKQKDPALPLSIWELNLQLAIGSLPVYGLLWWLADNNNNNNNNNTRIIIGQGWSWLTVIVAILGAAGGLLVALSIQYGDAILKTLATTTGCIVLAAVLNHVWMEGTLMTPEMIIAAAIVILSIGNYTLDATLPPPTQTTLMPPSLTSASHHSTMSHRRPANDVETGYTCGERMGLLEKES